MTSEIEAASHDLIEAMEPSPKEIADMAARYAALRGCQRVTADGDLLSDTAYTRERDDLNAQLKNYIDKHGPLHVEGIGTLVIQERRETVYDLAAVMESNPENFTRMVRLGCIKVDSAVMKAQVKAGNVFDPTQRIEQVASRALQIDTRG